MTSFLLILLLLFILSIGFLLKEFLRKFQFWKRFQNQYPYKLIWQYNWDKKAWMYTIRLSADRKFHGLIWFDFSPIWKFSEGYDVFWYIESWDSMDCTISLYLGSWHRTFVFLFDQDATVTFRLIEDNSITADYLFFPHWWQKIGIFS